MKLGEFLRQSRIEAGLTQEGMADKVGVSTTSVQNWEKNTFPDPQYWPLISKALSVKVTDIATRMAETVAPPKEEKSRKTCSFPEFLFPEGNLSRIKALRFTDEEMELLGLELVYSSGNCDALSYNADLPALPYEYIRLKGPWNVLSIHEEITHKLLGEYVSMVADWAKNALGSHSIFSTRPQRTICPFVNTFASQRVPHVVVGLRKSVLNSILFART